MYWLWNTALRGEEATPPNQWDVWERIQKYKNFWTNSVHALCSAIKKIQQSGHGEISSLMLAQNVCPYHAVRETGKGYVQQYCCMLLDSRLEDLGTY